MRIRRKVFCPGRLRCRYSEANEQEEIALAPPASDAAPNDSGLPSPDVSKRAEMAEKWCKFGSWQMCQTCRSMRPRPFWPGDLKRVAPPTVKKRGLCQRGVKVPQPGDVPEPLQALPRKVVVALRPLDIDVGVYEKVPHGYRVHSSMIRCAWAAEDVEDKIAALETRRQRKRARRAFRFLLEDDCKYAYADFVERHRLFLLAHPRAEERRRKLPLRCLEERGLECALWPHLYWDASLCETAVRLSDERRQWARRTGGSSRACFFRGLDPGCRAMFFVAAPWFSTSGRRLSEHFRDRNALGFARRRTSKLVGRAATQLDANPKSTPNR